MIDVKLLIDACTYWSSIDISNEDFCASTLAYSILLHGDEYTCYLDKESLSLGKSFYSIPKTLVTIDVKRANLSVKPV